MVSSPTKTKEEILVENLRDTKEILDKHNIKFWLDWGALLGAVRDKKLIPWDEDIDLGAMSEEYERILSIASEFKKRGFSMYERPLPFPNTEFPYRKIFLFRFGYLIDFWFYHFKDERAICPSDLSCVVSGNFLPRTFTNILWFSWYFLSSPRLDPEGKKRVIFMKLIKFISFLLPLGLKNYLVKILEKKISERKYRPINRQTVVPRHFFEKLDKIQFYGMTFNIPSNTEDYLRYKYGEHWKTPNKGWVYIRDDRTIKPFKEEDWKIS